MRTRFVYLLLIAIVLVSGCSRTGRQARHTERADRYVEQEQYAKAEIEYLNALRLAPNDVSLIRKLGRVYYAQGRNASAIAALGRVKERNPNDVEVRAWTAELLYRISGYVAARQEALFVATNQPTNGTTLLILAETSIGTTQQLEAARVLDQVAKASPGPGVHIARASLFGREGKLDLAEQELKQALQLNAPAPDIDFAFAKLRFSQTNIVEGETLLKRAADASPVRSFRRIYWVDFLLTRGKLDEAKRELEKIRHQADDFVPPIVRLATIALSEKRIEECDQLTKSALRLDAGSYEALLLRARMWTAQRKYETAIEEIVRLDALFVSNPAIKFELAAAYARAGEEAKALAAANEALKLDPRMYGAAILQSELNLRAGNFDTAIKILQDVLKHRPDHREAAALLASSYAGRGRTDDAIRVLRETTARLPNDPDVWNALGLILLRNKNDVNGARTAFEQSLKVNPRFVLAAEQLVNLDIAARDFRAALARATTILNLLTNSAAGHALQARVYTIAGDLKAAEAALLAGLEREPKSTGLYGLLAEIYVKAGNHEKALEKLDQITAQSTNAFSAWTMKGMLFESKGQWEQARTCYEKALQINKNVPVALNNLAVILSRDPKRIKEAQDLAARAVQNAPDSIEIADTLGWITYQGGDYNGARRIFADLTSKTSHPEVLYHAGLACYAAGDAQAAQTALGRAAQAESLPAGFRKDATNRLAVLAIDVRNATAQDVQRLEIAIKANEKDYLALFYLGTIHQVNGARAKAADSFRAAVRANPASAQPHLALARLFAGADDKSALEHARTARKLAPNDPAVAGALGALLVGTGDYAAGYYMLQEAQRAGVLSSPDEIFTYGVAQVSDGRVADALVTFNSILSNAPPRFQQSSRDAITLLTAAPQQKASLAEARLKGNENDLLALIASADSAYASNQAKEAARLYQKIVAVAPGYTPAHQRLAALYLDFLNDERSAYSHAIKAREASPNDPQIARILGKIALQRRQYAEAVRFAEEASRGLINDGEPYYLLGAAQLSLKRTNEAKIALNKAKKLTLKPDTAAATQRLLSEIK